MSRQNSTVYRHARLPSAGGALLKELKKVDDKALLVEVQLLESRAYHKIGNITKAR